MESAVQHIPIIFKWKQLHPFLHLFICVFPVIGHLSIRTGKVFRTAAATHHQTHKLYYHQVATLLLFNLNPIVLMCRGHVEFSTLCCFVESSLWWPLDDVILISWLQLQPAFPHLFGWPASKVTWSISKMRHHCAISLAEKWRKPAWKQ